MPHQNRVNPYGDLIATPERGTSYGNRGCLVDKNGKIARRFKEIRWITCVLDFKGRRHPMMAPGRYTGLFFLDEATALAAGHRPCAECQRGRFNSFRDYWSAANPDKADSDRPLAPMIDSVLHQERLGPKSLCTSIDELPDGTFVSSDGLDAYLVRKRELYLWTPAGYERPKTAIDFPARILTPASVTNALTNGYPVAMHPSAFDSPSR